MLGRRTLILFCCVVLTVKSVVVTQNEDYSPYSAAVIDFLNGNPNKIYNYKNAVLIDAQEKDNAVEVSIDVVASCTSNKPEEPCNDKLLTCFGTVQRSQEDDKYRVLNEVLCKPKDISAVDFRPIDESVEKSTATLQESKDESNKEPEILEKKTVRINGPCLGCPFDLNVNAEGAPELVNAALRHVESERANRHQAVKVIKLQSQIVAGIKYILVLEVAPTICQKDADVSAPCPVDNNAETLICRVVLWEKPWISPLKTIIKNNCTVSQEFVDYSFQNNDDIGNDINANLNSNAQKKNAEMDAQRLASLESQILQLEVTSKPDANVNPSSDLESQILQTKTATKALSNPTSDLEAQVQEVATKSTSNISPVSENQQTVEEESPVLRKMQVTTFAPCKSMVNQEQLETYKTNENDNIGNEESNDSSEQEVNSGEENVAKITKRSAKVDDDSSKSSSSSSSSEEGTTESIRKYQKENVEDNGKSSKSSSSSSSSSEESSQNNRVKRSIRQLEKITPDEKFIVRDLADFAAMSLDKVDDDNHKRIILQILGAKKLRLDGIYYQIILRLGISHCFEEDEDESCREKLFTNLTKICKVQVYVDENLSNPKLVKSQCQNIKKDEHDRNRTNYSRYRRALAASYERNRIAEETSAEDLSGIGLEQIKILQYVKTGLRVINSKSTEETKYVVRKIKDLSKRLVSGRLWEVTAELAPSDCPRDSDIEHCEELEGSLAKICRFSIWEQPWFSNGLRINITCENDENLYTFPPPVDVDLTSEVLVRFKDFMIKHNKTYTSRVEYNHRLKVFRSNLVKIELLNKYERGTGRYGITPFADLTADEFSRSHGLRLDLHNENNVPFMKAVIPDIELPTEFDWREKKAVTEVKNQGSCGSCWAFSTTGNIEGQYAIKYGSLLEFSEQELVDCDKLDNGCDGGLMDNAYRTIEKIGGLETEGDYPYDARDEKCNFNSTKARVRLSGALNISHDETDMAKWLVQNGPISIAINANAMQFYFGGVSHPWKFLCSGSLDSLDHGVLIVGYGVHNYPLFNKTLPYWIVKNSWGSSWGEQGYYRVYRGGGTCGLNQTPSSAIVA